MRALKELGRLHSAREALDAVAVARSIFDRYSFDLIYARPGQTPQAWAAELEPRHRRGRRASLALSAHHRAGHAVCGAACGGQARRPRRRHRAARSTTRRRLSARARACRPTRFPITRGRAPNAGTISSTGAAHEYAGIGPGAHGRLDIDGGASRHRDREAAGELADAGGSRSGTASSPTRRSRASKWRTSSC